MATIGCGTGRQSMVTASRSFRRRRSTASRNSKFGVNTMFSKVVIPTTLAAFAFGFPIAELTVHGLDLSLWPVIAQHPWAWFSAMANSYGLESLSIYRDMAFGRTNSLGPAGRLAAAWILA